MGLPDLRIVNIAKNINIKPHLDTERNDKSNTNLKGNEMGSGSTLMPVQALVRPFGLVSSMYRGLVDNGV